MNGSNSQMITEIKAAITNGALTYAEMKRRLDDAIDTELTKTTGEADLELIKACQSLLCEIHMHGTTIQNHTEQNLVGAKRRLQKHMKRYHFDDAEKDV